VVPAGQIVQLIAEVTVRAAGSQMDDHAHEGAANRNQQSGASIGHRSEAAGAAP